MQRERERQQPADPEAPVVGPGLEPPQDTAALTEEVLAQVAAVEVEPAAVTVQVRATASSGSGSAQILATRDTPLGEVMDHACQELGIEDRDRYLLVTRGEVLSDRKRPLGELVGEDTSSDLSMRLVRRPEAGRPRSFL